MWTQAVSENSSAGADLAPGDGDSAGAGGAVSQGQGEGASAGARSGHIRVPALLVLQGEQGRVQQHPVRVQAGDAAAAASRRRAPRIRSQTGQRPLFSEAVHLRRRE